MGNWGICTTVKAPALQVMAFVAHHLELGATRIWVHFDDPDDPAFDALAGIDGVTAIRCDEAYWARTCKRRPDAHQNRQARNMQRVYHEAALPWLTHIDVDEYLVGDTPVSEVLGSLAADRSLMRVAPFEALHDPSLEDDIFTARHFRAVVRGGDPARRKVFGRYAPLLPKGALSHSQGKCFFRTGVAGLEPRLHGAFMGKERMDSGAFHPALALLHFHAQDPDQWLGRLAFRLSKGAYHFNPALQAHLTGADEAEVAAFYRSVQEATPKTLTTLAEMGLLREAALGLRAKVAVLREGLE